MYQSKFLILILLVTLALTIISPGYPGISSIQAKADTSGQNGLKGRNGCLNPEKCHVEGGPGSVADGTTGTSNGNGHGRSIALDGGHTHQGCTDAIGKTCLNPH
jgi:hypothetical protein